MTTQTTPGVTLTEIFPGLPPILDQVMIGALIFATIGVVYLFIQWGIAHSKMEDIDAGTIAFHFGFITAISLPLILLNTTGSVAGLITGAAIGAVIALTTYLLLRRSRATHSRNTL